MGKKTSAKKTAKVPVKAKAEVKKISAKAKPAKTAPKPEPVAQKRPELAKASMRRPSVKVQEDVQEAKKEYTMTKRERAEAERPKVRIIGLEPKKVIHVVVPGGKPTLLAASKESYTKAELAEFKKNLEDKLKTARQDYELLLKTLTNLDNNGTDDTFRPMKADEDSNEGANKAEADHLLGRQKRFITDLENAQQRLKNGTYGICMITGRLISPERLRLVPHATLSAEAKQQKNSNESKGSITGAPIRKMSKVA